VLLLMEQCRVGSACLQKVVRPLANMGSLTLQ